MVSVLETLPNGTSVLRQGDRIVEVRGRDDRVHAVLTWSDAGLDRATLRLPDHRLVSLSAGAVRHPVFGEVDRLSDEAGQTLAFFGRVDWARPTVVPPLDRPGALPPGAGAAVLNLLALSARSADVPRLRYRGPYATAALFDALLQSFVVEGDPSEALARFTADVERTAVVGSMVTVDVDFVPAPHEWSWPHERVCVQRRDGIERIYVDGRAFEARRRGPRRVLQEPGGGAVAAIVVGDTVWAKIATVDPDGGMPHALAPLPEAPKDLIGTRVPVEVTTMLAGVVASRAAGVMEAAIHEVLASTPLVWGDPGLDIVRDVGPTIEIHAGLVAALPTQPTALLGALLTLIEPVALRLAQARMADAHDTLLRR